MTVEELYCRPLILGAAHLLWRRGGDSRSKGDVPVSFTQSNWAVKVPVPQPGAGQQSVNDIHSKLNPTIVGKIVPATSLESVQAAVSTAGRQGGKICVAGGRHAMGAQQ